MMTSNMTQDEIIWQNEVLEMARQARLMSEYDESSPWVENHEITEYVTAFAKLVADKERKTILLNTMKARNVDGNCDIVLCAEIRTRGEQHEQ